MAHTQDIQDNMVPAQKKTFLYAIKFLSRRGQLSGISCGTIRAESRETAMMKLLENSGDYAYAVNLIDVTDRDGEAYFSIPSGELLAFDNR